MERNWSYTIPEGEHKGETLWSGRYCCVCAAIFCKSYVKGNWKWFVLANKRGINCPDYVGYWNLPCGFIECSETGEQAASRETLEETGVFIYPDKFQLHSVNTDPIFSNKSHVTVHYTCKLERKDLPYTYFDDPDEVSDSKWIPISKINDCVWAFHHKEFIEELIHDDKYLISNDI